VTLDLGKTITTSALIYTRVSTSEQGESGLGLDVQVARCEGYAARIDANVIAVLREVQSAKNMTKRPMLLDCLQKLKTGEANVLIVAKLDRLSRSVIDLCSLLEQSEKENWSLVLLDLGIDTTTPAGRVQAQVIAAFAEYERRLISQRTKEAMKAAKDRGVHCGVTSKIQQEIVERIVNERLGGATWMGICDGLDADGVATAREAEFWQVGSAQSVFNSSRGKAHRRSLGHEVS
jgi:DNA invertase Pin-like site-specific DNA recombinase